MFGLLWRWFWGSGSPPTPSVRNLTVDFNAADVTVDFDVTPVEFTVDFRR